MLNRVDALQKARDIQIDNYKSVNNRINQFQLVSFILMIILVGLIYRYDFSVPDYDKGVNAYFNWIDNEYWKKPYLEDIKLNEFEILSETQRKLILQLVEVDNVKKEFDQNQTVNFIYDQILNYYGFDPILVNTHIGELKKIGGEYADKNLSELKNIMLPKKLFSFSGPVSVHQKLQGIIAKHPKLQMPVDTVNAKKFSDLAIEEIMTFKDTNDETILKWEAMDKKLKNWKNWKIEEFDSITNSDYEKWSVMLDRFGPKKNEIVRAIDEKKSISEAVKTINAYVSEQKSLREGEKEKFSFWSIPVVIPKLEITLLFPFIFIIVTLMYRTLLLRRRIYLIKTVKLDNRIDNLLKMSTANSLVNQEVLNTKNFFSYVREGSWAKLFDNNPFLFSEVFYSIGFYLLSFYLLYRWFWLVLDELFSVYNDWQMVYGVVAICFILVLFVVVQLLYQKIRNRVLFHYTLEEVNP